MYSYAYLYMYSPYLTLFFSLERDNIVEKEKKTSVRASVQCLLYRYAHLLSTLSFFN